MGDALLDARRAMMPTFPLLILLAAVAASRALRTPVIRFTVVSGACAAIALPNFPGMYRWVASASQEGLGFRSRRWRASATMAFIQELPTKTIVYTDLPEPVYLITGRNARFLPRIADPHSREGMTPAEVDSAVSEVARHARSGYAVAVYFLADEARASAMVAGPDLAARCGLMRAMAFEDGTAYASADVGGSPRAAPIRSPR